MQVVGEAGHRLAAGPHLARHPGPRAVPQALGWCGPALPGLPVAPLGLQPPAVRIDPLALELGRRAAASPPPPAPVELLSAVAA